MVERWRSILPARVRFSMQANPFFRTETIYLLTRKEDRKRGPWTRRDISTVDVKTNQLHALSIRVGFYECINTCVCEKYRP